MRTQYARDYDKNKYQKCKALGICARCRQPLDRPRAHCGACSIVLREYRKKTAHVARERARRWRENNLEKDQLSHRWNKIRRTYGITKEQYDQLLAAQDGKCAICRDHPERGLCVDHRHSDGTVRGLLCHDCNRGLGNFKDKVAMLEAAIRYLNI